MGVPFDSLKKLSRTNKGADSPDRGAKSKAKSSTDLDPVVDTRPDGQQGKGRATPSRKQAEQAKVRPLVGPKTKTANMTKEQRREASRLARERYNQGMRTGEDRYLPARDKGPIKRFTRDWVDSRRSFAEYFIWIAIAMLLILAVMQQASPTLAMVIMLGIYVMLFVLVGDLYRRSRQLKRALHAKFGEDAVPKGSVRYGVMRIMQFRRGRQPKPQVARGQYPK